MWKQEAVNLAGVRKIDFRPSGGLPIAIADKHKQPPTSNRKHMSKD